MIKVQGRITKRAFNSGFRSMKWLGVSQLLPGENNLWLAFTRFPWQLIMISTYWNFSVEKGAVRVKCLTQEHSAMLPVGARALNLNIGKNWKISHLPNWSVSLVKGLFRVHVNIARRSSANFLKVSFERWSEGWRLKSEEWRTKSAETVSTNL